MYGIISFLQSRYHHLSEHEIVQCLVACRGDLPLAADEAMVIKAGQQSPCAGLQEACEAAATAAWHPNPTAQAAFLTSCKAKLQESPAAMLLLQQGGDRKPTYSLLVICGANDSVCGPEYYCSKQEDYLSFAPCEYRYTHVNFLATEKTDCSPSSPVLFFAEFDNKKAEGEPAIMCCKVDMPLPFAEHVRCLYCEVEGAKIVHPALEKFHGGDKEFEEVIRGKHSLTNSRIICLNEYAVQRLYAHDEDFMYVDVA
ncbi:hypothetical protein OsI_12677 [Oryza sativa Indica Group]|uniref:DUF3615 domain-containing protein n=1 Tax=Oryza sativa subsp. indica TaxID=39946 RepID=B8AMN2_ORYSI|nr:hypothetical protein OsI_12677 [Oryza sativa Indica Group]